MIHCLVVFAKTLRVGQILYRYVDENDNLLFEYDKRKWDVYVKCQDSQIAVQT